jgi:hypothetical protein
MDIACLETQSRWRCYCAPQTAVTIGTIDAGARAATADASAVRRLDISAESRSISAPAASAGMFESEGLCTFSPGLRPESGAFSFCVFGESLKAAPHTAEPSLPRVLAPRLLIT